MKSSQRWRKNSYNKRKRRSHKHQRVSLLAKHCHQVALQAAPNQMRDHLQLQLAVKNPFLRLQEPHLVWVDLLLKIVVKAKNLLRARVLNLRVLTQLQQQLQRSVGERCWSTGSGKRRRREKRQSRRGRSKSARGRRNWRRGRERRQRGRGRCRKRGKRRHTNTNK